MIALLPFAVGMDVNVTGCVAVPPEGGPMRILPRNVTPPSNRIESPGPNVTPEILAGEPHASAGLVPAAASFPDEVM
jgi:hypothetical protein